MGTAINVARDTFAKIRAAFGRLAKGGGLKLKGIEGHHDETLARFPEKAIDPNNIRLVERVQHRLAHALERAFGKLKNLTASAGTSPSPG